MAKEKKSKMRQEIDNLCEENEFYSMKQSRNRARSVTVGTAFGGVVEINMRSDGASVYAQMQPIEAIELIEQIAAGVGVEIAMRPKQNFATWRGWNIESGDERFLEWKGAAPWQINHAKEMERIALEEAKEEPKAALEPAEEEKPAKKPRRTRKKVKETGDE